MKKQRNDFISMGRAWLYSFSFFVPDFQTKAEKRRGVLPCISRTLSNVGRINNLLTFPC